MKNILFSLLASILAAAGAVTNVTYTTNIVGGVTNIYATTNIVWTTNAPLLTVMADTNGVFQKPANWKSANFLVDSNSMADAIVAGTSIIGIVTNIGPEISPIGMTFTDFTEWRIAGTEGKTFAVYWNGQDNLLIAWIYKGENLYLTNESKVIITGDDSLTLMGQIGTVVSVSIKELQMIDPKESQSDPAPSYSFFMNRAGGLSNNLATTGQAITNLVGTNGINGTNYASYIAKVEKTNAITFATNAANITGILPMGTLTADVVTNGFMTTTNGTNRVYSRDGQYLINVNAASVGGYGTNGLVIYGRRHYSITDFWPQSAISQVGPALWGAPMFPMLSNSSTTLYIPIRNNDLVGSGTNVTLKARIYTTNNAVVGPLRIRTYSTDTTGMQAGADGGGPKAFSSSWPNDTCTVAPAGTNFWTLTLNGTLNVSNNPTNISASISITPNGTKTNFWISDVELDFR